LEFLGQNRNFEERMTVEISEERMRVIENIVWRGAKVVFFGLVVGFSVLVFWLFN